MNFRRSKQVAGRKGRDSKHSPGKGSRSFKPAVESLEDRTQPASSTTILTAQYTPVAAGVTDLLTATISVPVGSASPPMGTVTFSDVSNGVTTVLGMANVAQISSSPDTFAATLPAILTTEGSHYLSAAFSGDGTFDPSAGTATVNSGTTAVDFENLSLPPNSFENGANLSGGFGSGGAQFNNNYNPTFDAWSGWSYSNVADVTTAGFGNQYAAYNVPGGGTGFGGSADYGVAFGFPGDGGFPGDPITIALPAGQRPESMQVTNTTYAALSMQNGDFFAKKFGGSTGNDPDFFLLTITGVNASGQDTGTLTFYLADYRFADNSQDYIVSQWTTVDLSSLPSDTATLSFALSSSDVGMFGVNTPTFFAMDDLILAPDVSVIASPAGPVSAGTPVTFTATVADSPSVGTVTFYAGPGLTNQIGAPVPVVNGTATSDATTTLPSGTNTVIAVYSGGTGFDPSQSSVDITINAVTATSVVAAPTGPVTAGTAVSFTATVTGNPSVGTVTFYAGPGLTNPIGTPVAVVNGAATSVATSALPIGSNTITAVYSGGTAFDPSQGTVGVAVNAATTTTVAATPAGPVTAGTPVTFTATVAGSPSVGTVTFYAGPGMTNQIGTPVAVAAGTATSDAVTLPVGVNTITAVYSGGTGFAGSQGTAAGLTVNVATATSVVGAPAGPVTVGTSVTFTATVTGNPSVGTVTFYAGPGLTNPIGAPVAVLNGSATSAATTTLPVGTNTITAVYSGGTAFDSSQGTVGVAVNAATTTTVAATPAGPVTAGTPVTFTATIAGSPSVGTVTFYAGPGLTNQIGTPVAVAGGTATSAATSALPVGSDTITAVYSGGAGFAGSQGTVGVTVNATTATSVTASPSGPVTAGTLVSFTATVTGSPSVGTVTFYAGPGLTNPIGAPVAVAGGTATSAATAALPVGSTTITAVYSGGTGFAGSQGTVGITVNATTATSVVAAPAGPVTVGTPVTFTATVTGNPSVGTVTFYAGPGLTNPIGTPVAVTGGTATSTATTALSTGTNAVTAVYSGGTGFAGSQGATGITVNAATATTVAATPSGPVMVGVPVTFTATVTGNPSVGTVTFYAGPGLTNQIGTPVPVAAGTATSSATATLPVGMNAVTAVYSGGLGFDPSQSSVDITIDAATTTTTVVAAPAGPVTAGTSVAFTATVTGSPSVGTVAFYAGPGLTNQIGTPVAVTGGTATSAATAALPVGSTTITAVYSGGTGFAGSQGTTGVTVNAATTTNVTVGPAGPVTAGVPVTFTAVVTGNPSAGTVTFYAGPGLTNPIGVPVAVLNGSATSASTTTLPVGTNTITAVYSGGTGFAGSHGTTGVTVNAATSTSIVAVPSGPVTVGTLVGFTATVTGGPSVGTVTFFAGPGLTNQIGTPVAVVNGSAISVATAALTVGANTVTAVYSGGTGFAGSQGTTSVTVNAATANPATIGVPQFAVGSDVGGPSVVTEYNADGSVAKTFDPFPGATGGVRTAVGDFNGDGTPDVAVGVGPGATAQVKVLDGKTGAVLFDVTPFADFTGGVFVALGDVTGDGKADLVITPDVSGGPRVSVFRGGDLVKIADFFGIDDPNFRGGARAALGDMNGDGVADLVVSAGIGGGPRISVYDGKSLAGGQQVHLVPDFFLFEDTLRNGAYVAVGDVNGDGFADIIGGGGPGGGPRVLALSGKTLLTQGAATAIESPIANFFAGDDQNRGGIRVSVKDLDGDKQADIVVGSGTGAGSAVTVYTGSDLTNHPNDPTAEMRFDAFPGFTGGVYVG